MKKERRPAMLAFTVALALIRILVVFVRNPSWRDKDESGFYHGLRRELGGRGPIGVAGRLSEERRSTRSESPAVVLAAANRAYEDEEYEAALQA